MGTIICQNCNEIIEHYEDEKVSIHYSQCGKCLEDISLKVVDGQIKQAGVLYRNVVIIL